MNSALVLALVSVLGLGNVDVARIVKSL